jgi:putative cardiolipin synthase
VGSHGDHAQGYHLENGRLLVVRVAISHIAGLTTVFVRAITGRLGESVAELERVNQRMHNKVMIVDNRATFIGGRNIGDEYMGLNASFNFHDIDVLGIGPVARQASAVFDSYWNSEWVMPVSALQLQITPEEQSGGRRQLMKNLEEAESLAQSSLSPRSWSNELAELQQRLYIGTSRVESDLPRGAVIDHVMLDHIHDLMAAARRELLIVNAYIIPTDQGIDRLREFDDRGVKVRILTNSLASHDVPAVNSHYKRWRKPILAAGADLYELRHDGQMRQQVADTAPTRSRFMGLHSKAMVVDRSSVFIGSMNYDPRSALFNTEMGVFIESTGLGAALETRLSLSSTSSARNPFTSKFSLSIRRQREIPFMQWNYSRRQPRIIVNP